MLSLTGQRHGRQPNNMPQMRLGKEKPFPDVKLFLTPVFLLPSFILFLLTPNSAGTFSYILIISSLLSLTLLFPRYNANQLALRSINDSRTTIFTNTSSLLVQSTQQYNLLYPYQVYPYQSNTDQENGTSKPPPSRYPLRRDRRPRSRRLHRLQHRPGSDQHHT